MKYLPVLTVLVLGWMQDALAQNPEADTVLVIGQVLEEESYTGLPFAHVRVGEKATTTDFRGIFKVRLGMEDTIHVSYVGYKTEELTLPDGLTTPLFETKIILKKDTIMLEDAKVTILPASVESFKRAVLALDLNSQEYQNVRRNMEAMARQLTIYNYDKYAMDAGENQRAALAGPQGFNILGVLKKLRSALMPPESKEASPAPPPVYYQPTHMPDSLPASDTLMLIRSDSTLRKIDN